MALLEKLASIFGYHQTIPTHFHEAAETVYEWTDKIHKAAASGEAVELSTLIPAAEPLREAILAATGGLEIVLGRILQMGIPEAANAIISKIGSVATAIKSGSTATEVDHDTWFQMIVKALK